ncbi:hypothetical protein BX600DRAFT_471652 [Xylariales sp. PMI_506]|nr:hypothetical protein BX600DRAFT_471652 [Xylariales sp. PMI_506]
MQPRRSHAKSRNGCQRCKQRHIKCDETGPPCTNCSARGTECVYSNGGRLSLASKATQPQHQPLQQQPCLVISKPSRRLLELELMHRWSTSTYRTLAPDEGERYVLQVQVPREALRYDFMLNGIYAMSALDLADGVLDDGATGGPLSSSSPSLYLAAALEYYGKASAGFRAELGQISRDSHHVLFVFAFLAAIFHLALPLPSSSSPPLPSNSNSNNSGSSSTISSGSDISVDDILLCGISGDLGNLVQRPMLRRIITLFIMYTGVAWVTRASFDWLVESSAPAREMLAQEPASPDVLDADTAAALERLGMAVEILTNDKDDNTFTSVSPPWVNHGSKRLYQRAASWLTRCFAEEKKGVLVGFCMSWPAVLGGEFAAAIAELDHLALFLLLHWAVLLHQVPGEMWWADSVGEEVVAEISDILQASPCISSLVPQWQLGISWVRLQVGLPELRV